MKVLSIIVPCYNSQDYLAHAVHSFIAGGKRVEILLVDDGSTDRTPALIDNYAAQFQGQVRAIHQSNKGHGGAVNAGLQQQLVLMLKSVIAMIGLTQPLWSEF